MGTVLALLFRLATRNLSRNTRRSAITLCAIAVGVWSSVSLSSLARGISYGMVEDSINTLTGHIQLHAASYSDEPVVEHSMPPLSAELEAAMSALAPHWSVRVRVPAVVVSERESAAVQLVGIVPSREKGLSFIGTSVRKGRYLDDDERGSIIVGKALADSLRTALGKRVVLMSEDTNNSIAERGLRIKGIFEAKLEATERSFVFVPLHTAQEMLSLGKNVSEVALRLAHTEDTDQAANRLTSVAGDAKVETWRELTPFVVALLDVQNRFIGFWFSIVFVAVAFGIINTLLMAIFERTREIGLLQALGMRPRLIVAEVVAESLLLVLLGAVLGNLAGVGTVTLLSDGLDISAFAKGGEYVGIGRIIYPKILLGDWIQVNLLVVVMATLSSLYPAWHAARLTPQRALTKT